MRTLRCFRRLAQSRAFTTPKDETINLRSKATRGVLREVPCINDVIAAHKGYEDIAVSYCSQSISKVRCVDDSFVSLLLPFSESEVLREAMIKFDGKTIRYGKLFELIDAIAGDVGYRHCTPDSGSQEQRDFYVVTASVDGMQAFSDIRADENLRLEGFLTWVGTTSMEVHVNILSVPTAQAGSIRPPRLAGSTQFIMVARSKATDKSYKVPGLFMSDEDLHAGQERSGRRKRLALESLQLSPPAKEEVEMLHKLYLDAQYLKLQKKALMDRKQGEILSRQTNRRRFKYMKHTVQHSVNLMHFQQRNIHGKIFGGHLMRMGFEIGYITAACFFGNEAGTHFHSVDDIQFVRPANVGSVMEFVGTATFSRPPYVVVEVIVRDVNVATGIKSTTNQLSFVFACDTEADVPDVIPREYDEYIKHLQGKRSLERILAGQ